MREREPPEHPSPSKEKALRSRGQQPLRTALYRASAVDLTRIDGISVGASRTIVTEIGPDLSAFPSEAHCLAWLALARRAAISGGKARHKGVSVAIFRIARKLARLVYRMLRNGQDYVDIGAKAYEERFRRRAVTSLQAWARSLGCTVVPRAPPDQPTPLAQPA